MGLGDTASREVVGDGGVETNVRVNDDSGADDGVHDGAHGASSEGSNAERDETGRDDSLKSPVVATLGRVRLGDGSGVVHCVELSEHIPNIMHVVFKNQSWSSEHKSIFPGIISP